MSNIVEGANSTMKALVPSFVCKPAKLGAFCEQERAVFVDEIGKMIEREGNKHEQNSGNILGELNALLDNKRRSVGSGNDNDCEIQATCKSMLVSNPAQNKQNIYQHVGLLDPTTMSREIHWVQDPEEVKFVLSPEGIIRPKRVPPTLSQDPPQKADLERNNLTDEKAEEKENIYENNDKKNMVLERGRGRIDSRSEFITLFDSCYSFVCDLDDSKVEGLVNETTMLAREPMKTSVWKPRAFHHVYLLIDGLVKHRCLFKDYDPTFTPKQEDYDLAERILVRMVKSWDTDLSPKKEIWN